jgi:hypothetical protein
MSDANDNQPQDQAPAEPVSLPPQASPQDTSNWDDRAFTTPTDRIVIETYQGSDNDIVIAE